MIIDSSTIELAASHQKSEVKQQQTSHQLFLKELQALVIPPGRMMQRWSGYSDQGNKGAGVMSALDHLSTASKVASIQPYLAQFIGLGPDNSSHFRLAGVTPKQVSGANSLNGSMVEGWYSSMNSSIRLFQALFDALSGRSHQLLPPVSSDRASTDSADSMQSPDQADSTNGSSVPVIRFSPNGSSPIRPMVEVHVQVSEYYKETECSSFSACGQVRTRDGEMIDFNLNLEMSRSYESVRQYQRTEMMEFKDPLVINFNGSAAELTDDKYEFDLDADGELDWISFVDGDGGLLARDQNEDGLINDGTELFGALSGNGFADLSQYDNDDNGFIDEADEIFGDLRIWSKSDGGDRLESLLDRNIGAIYLGSTDTPFELKDTANQQQGRVRQSGIYLNETGGVGTVQQIDMVV